MLNSQEKSGNSNYSDKCTSDSFEELGVSINRLLVEANESGVLEEYFNDLLSDHTEDLLSKEKKQLFEICQQLQQEKNLNSYIRLAEPVIGELAMDNLKVENRLLESNEEAMRAMYGSRREHESLYRANFRKRLASPLHIKNQHALIVSKNNIIEEEVTDFREITDKFETNTHRRLDALDSEYMSGLKREKVLKELSEEIVVNENFENIDLQQFLDPVITAYLSETLFRSFKEITNDEEREEFFGRYLLNLKTESNTLNLRKKINGILEAYRPIFKDRIERFNRINDEISATLKKYSDTGNRQYTETIAPQDLRNILKTQTKNIDEVYNRISGRGTVIIKNFYGLNEKLAAAQELLKEEWRK